MAKTVIKPLTPSLTWLTHLMSLYSAKAIHIPGDFREQCVCVEGALMSDSSGLVNSILDFAIESAMVDYSVETSSKGLTKILDTWLKNINVDLRGKIPVGIKNLAKEYFKERWKGSSFIMLRTIWESEEEFSLPNKLWFVNGKDLEIVDEENETLRVLGEEKYRLIVGKDKTIPLPRGKSEMIFVQKPYEKWSADYPVPFLIRRGVYFNMKFLELLSEKGATVLGKALEYLMLMKKGDAELAKLGKPDFTYSEEDLKKVNNDFQDMLNDRNNKPGVPAYTTNFDTDISHLIPEYEKALQSGLYTPVERRILGGLGFIEVVEGITSTRKDAILNPRAFIAEIKAGIEDFVSLMTDVIMTSIEMNRASHRKMANAEMIQLRTSPVKSFYNEDVLDFIRALYDRGLVSKRTMIELGVGVDFDAEVERRKREKEDGLEETMFPPVTQNIDEQVGAAGAKPTETSPDKTGPEKKNFTNL